MDLVGLSEGETVELIAAMQASEYSRTASFAARPAIPEKTDLRPSLQREAVRMLQELPEQLTAERQILPVATPYGANATWNAAKAGLPWEVLGLFLFLSAFLLFSRTDPVQRRLKQEKAAFEREIPNMSLQMILLLNAGLTVEGAFQRLIAENKDRSEPLYKAFSSLDAESRATNVPFVNALYVYARQSGIRDLIRFSSLALDCSGRGSELAEKLDRERQQLWNGRLDRAKAQARTAETKLCLPLMVLLLVLVVIATAPALMEM